MPTILRLRGYRFFFFSGEGGEPSHIHVESAENYAKFWLDGVALAESVGYNAVELGRLRRLVVEHRDMFVERWYGHFGRPET